MGAGLPAAIAVAILHPHRRVLAVCEAQRVCSGLGIVDLLVPYVGISDDFMGIVVALAQEVVSGLTDSEI
jgi:hypothetical protein